MSEEPAFGTGDASYQAAGGWAGIRQLVHDFYAIMHSEPWARPVAAMHSRSLEESEDRLARFLSAWLGGPRRYSERYGPINIPGAHAHLPVDDNARQIWLRCMELAIAQQPYTAAFSHYLLTQLGVPAQRIQQRIQQQKAQNRCT